jgi:hypothetical protein
MAFKDSLGNVYSSLPKQKPSPGPKPTKIKTAKKRLRNPARLAKFERYRTNIGRPNGPGQPGNKSGKNKIR